MFCQRSALKELLGLPFSSGDAAGGSKQRAPVPIDPKACAFKSHGRSNQVAHRANGPDKQDIGVK